MSAAVGALAGLKVVELGQLIAGPFAARTLADFGADVVKIEPPGAGDPLRNWRLLKDGTSRVVAGAVAQQALAGARPAAARRPGHRAPARRRGRRAGRELPARRAGRLGPRLRDVLSQPTRGLIDAAHQRLRADRSVSRPPGLRRGRRGDGRPAPPDGGAGPRAGARGREHRRHAGGAARRDRHADGAARPQATRAAAR